MAGKDNSTAHGQSKPSGQQFIANIPCCDHYSQVCKDEPPTALVQRRPKDSESGQVRKRGS